jgi:hypothetical protein
MNDFVIYALADPVTGDVRYIGRCFLRRVHERYHGHLTDARLLRDRSHKTNWIRKLLQNGHKPLMELLECTSAELVDERERAWIAGFRNLGNRMTNSCDGGKGNKGFKHRPESIEKFRSKLLGKPKTPEHRRNLSKAKTGLRMSIEARRQMSLQRFGRRRSVASVMKTAAFHRGKKRPTSTLAKMRNTWAKRLQGKIPGVRIGKRGRFEARICYAGRYRYIGGFNSRELAEAAILKTRAAIFQNMTMPR